MKILKEREMFKKSSKPFYIFILVFLTISLACGSSDNAGSKVGEADSTKTKENTPEAVPSKEVVIAATQEPTITVAPTEIIKPREKFSVGDIIELPDQIIVLTGAEFKGSVLVADFVIGNTSDEFISISSMLSFYARSADGTNLDTEFFDCGTSIDGPIAPGDKLRGRVCWEGAAPGTKIYYEENRFDTGAIIWEINESIPNSDLAIPEIDKLVYSGESFNVGEEVSFESEKVVLNTAEIKNGILIANFSVYATGTEEINVSSMLSFDAQDKTGRNLSQSYFDCPSGGLDGTVQPGDVLKGNICWEDATSGTKLIYEYDLFDSEYAIWIID
ncbi:MAG: hypothetical protein ABFD58_05075 [Anaerolineaceae bacterium]